MDVAMISKFMKGFERLVPAGKLTKNDGKSPFLQENSRHFYGHVQ